LAFGLSTIALAAPVYAPQRSDVVPAAAPELVDPNGAATDPTKPRTTDPSRAPPGTAARPKESTVPTRIATDYEKSNEKRIDPATIAELNRMGTFLRAQQSFRVRAETTSDRVTEGDQNVQVAGTVDLSLRRPDKLHIDAVTDTEHRVVAYDGKAFTIFRPDKGNYAAFQSPAATTTPIGSVVARADKQFAIDLPLRDVFYWESPGSGAENVVSARHVGSSTVDGTPCQHYAFRLKNEDWQVWVTQGTEPVPRKIVVTTTALPSQPQRSSVLRWDLNTNPADTTFHFVPPKGAHQIDFNVDLAK